jgi:hypothetical protein
MATNGTAREPRARPGWARCVDADQRVLESVFSVAIIASEGQLWRQGLVLECVTPRVGLGIAAR